MHFVELYVVRAISTHTKMKKHKGFIYKEMVHLFQGLMMAMQIKVVRERRREGGQVAKRERKHNRWLYGIRR